jgi:hypothetical protein
MLSVASISFKTRVNIRWFAWLKQQHRIHTYTYFNIQDVSPAFRCVLTGTKPSVPMRKCPADRVSGLKYRRNKRNKFFNVRIVNQSSLSQSLDCRPFVNSPALAGLEFTAIHRKWDRPPDDNPFPVIILTFHNLNVNTFLSFYSIFYTIMLFLAQLAPRDPLLGIFCAAKESSRVDCVIYRVGTAFSQFLIHNALVAGKDKRPFFSVSEAR